MPTAMILQAAGGEMQVRDYQRAEIFLRRQGYEVTAPDFSLRWFGEESMRARGVRSRSLVYHSKYAEQASRCDLIFCMKGYDKGLLAKTIHDVCKAYGVNILYEV